MPPKVKEISELLIDRIQNGDYAINQLPSGRKLASEVGVSYLTARRALERVVDKGWLVRNSTGRLELGKKPKAFAQLKVAFVCPAFASEAYFWWLHALQEVVEQRGGLVRQISYGHWNDPVIFDSLTGDFDGIVIVPPVDMPKVMAAQLARYRNRLVTLFHDMTDQGVPMLDGPTAESIDMLVEHLYQLGHRRIDCINTQPKNQIINERIEQWWKSLASRGLNGVLHDAPVKPYEHAGKRANLLMGQVFNDNRFKATAAFCTTVTCAQGTMRAMANYGIEIGRDISICSFGEDDTAALMIPSLTTIKDVDPRGNLSLALDWVTRPGEEWDGPMVLRPEKTELQLGESTQQIRLKKKSSKKMLTAGK